MANDPTREDTFKVKVKVRHPVTKVMEDFGIWDQLDGGEVDSDDTKYYPGGMEDPVALGGKRMAGNVTLSRLYRLERDHGHLNTLLVAAGKSDAQVIKHTLDLDGNVYGKPLTYNGKLKRCTPPPHNSEGTGPAKVEIEITIDGFPAVG